MISLNSEKTVEILLENIPELKKRWSKNDTTPFLPLKVQNRNHYFNKKTELDIKFKNTGYLKEDNINILFAHFPLLKYEMEAIEMPLYASKVFSNANIDTWYFDSRGNLDSKQQGYLHSIKSGKILEPKNNFLEKYDLMITRSSTIIRMRSVIPEVLNRCEFKVNMQTNNHIGCIGIGEDYSLCYTDFFAPAGRKFADRSENLSKTPGFRKRNIIAFVGSVVWWKGQAEWIEAIDPDLVRGYTVLMLGPAKDSNYLKRIVDAAHKKKIDLLYSDYVHPEFLCDILTYSKISVMNPFMEPPYQLALGPARTVGESIACSNICLHANTKDKNGLNGMTMSLPEEWKDYIIEFDNKDKDSYNKNLEIAVNFDTSTVDFSKQISMEQKCDQLFEKFLNEKHNEKQ